MIPNKTVILTESELLQPAVEETVTQIIIMCKNYVLWIANSRTFFKSVVHVRH